jgi:ribosomal protein S27AE
MSDENPGRALVAKRKRVEARCVRCGEPFMARLKDGHPERSYCSDSCRTKAYYQNHKSERAAYQREKRRTQAAPSSAGVDFGPWKGRLFDISGWHTMISTKAVETAGSEDHETNP